MKALRSLGLLLLCFCGSAQADVYQPAFLEIRQTAEESSEVLWKVPTRGPDRRLGIYLDWSDEVILPATTRSVYVDNAFVDTFTIQHPGGLAGARIGVDGLDRINTEVLVRIEGLDGSARIERLTPDKTAFTVARSQQGLEVAQTYALFGMQHIWAGIDHLLFVACLILIAGSWRRILITITGFTIAHSITLSLAALELLQIPVAPVEAVIALSIVLLAREIAVERRDSLTWRYPITVSASFGLLHGFGFASALAEIGLPPGEIPLALLSFNIGVEVGQILFVAVLILLARAGQRLLRLLPTEPVTAMRTAQVTMVYAIGGLASFWMIQRIDAFWS